MIHARSLEPTVEAVLSFIESIIHLSNPQRRQGKSTNKQTNQPHLSEDPRRISASGSTLPQCLHATHIHAWDMREQYLGYSAPWLCDIGNGAHWNIQEINVVHDTVRALSYTCSIPPRRCKMSLKPSDNTILFSNLRSPQ
jgi:hypothetical protein